MDLKIYFIVMYSILISGCAVNENHKLKNEDFSQRNCICEVCFHNKPVLIDSTLDQTNYNGLLLKVYDIHFEKNEPTMSGSFTKKGFKKFPLDWHEIPHLLTKYIALNDSGYYKYDDSNGDRYLILDYTTHKFILYDQGLLIDLYREDSLNGKLR